VVGPGKGGGLSTQRKKNDTFGSLKLCSRGKKKGKGSPRLGTEGKDLASIISGTPEGKSNNEGRDEKRVGHE